MEAGRLIPVAVVRHRASSQHRKNIPSGLSAGPRSTPSTTPLSAPLGPVIQSSTLAGDAIQVLAQGKGIGFDQPLSAPNIPRARGSLRTPRT